MKIRPVRNDDDHARAMSAIDALWGSKPGTPEGDALDVQVQLVHDYEEVHHALPIPTLAQAIHWRIVDGGVPREAFEEAVGGPATLDAILTGTADPSLASARILVDRLGISAASILPDRSLAA